MVGSRDVGKRRADTGVGEGGEGGEEGGSGEVVVAGNGCRGVSRWLLGEDTRRGRVSERRRRRGVAAEVELYYVSPKTVTGATTMVETTGAHGSKRSAWRRWIELGVVSRGKWSRGGLADLLGTGIRRIVPIHPCLPLLIFFAGNRRHNHPLPNLCPHPSPQPHSLHSYSLLGDALGTGCLLLCCASACMDEAHQTIKSRPFALFTMATDTYIDIYVEYVYT